MRPVPKFKPQTTLGIICLCAGFFFGIGTWCWPTLGQIIGTVLAVILFVLGSAIIVEK